MPAPRVGSAIKRYGQCIVFAENVKLNKMIFCVPHSGVGSVISGQSGIVRTTQECGAAWLERVRCCKQTSAIANVSLLFEQSFLTLKNLTYKGVVE
jgi:hypothetical protein